MSSTVACFDSFAFGIFGSFSIDGVVLADNLKAGNIKSSTISGTGLLLAGSLYTSSISVSFDFRGLPFFLRTTGVLYCLSAFSKSLFEVLTYS